MMLVVNVYQGYGIKRRKRWFKGKCCKIYGPTICTSIAAILILADQFRHVAQDTGVWPECDRGKFLTDGVEQGGISLDDLPYGAETAQACLWSSGQFACEFPSKEFIDAHRTNSTWTKAFFAENMGCTAAAQNAGWPATRWDLKKYPKMKAQFPTEAEQKQLQCGCVLTSDENMGHLSFIGILFTLFFTYSGFVVLMIGTLWNANIMDKCGKIKKTWQQMRGKPTTSTRPQNLQHERGVEYHAVGV